MHNPHCTKHLQIKMSADYPWQTFLQIIYSLYLKDAAYGIHKRSRKAAYSHLLSAVKTDKQD
jgi:hypothetical protein